MEGVTLSLTEEQVAANAARDALRSAAALRTAAVAEAQRTADGRINDTIKKATHQGDTMIAMQCADSATRPAAGAAIHPC